MFNRFLSLCSIGLLFLTLSAVSYAATPTEPLWPTLKISYFGDREIREDATDLLVIEAPKRAEDAAIVPISVKSLIPQSEDKFIKNIHIIIDNNPEPYSANFHLSPKLGLVDISTRMRVDQYTFVRAIAEMNDGSLHMVSRFVKASGGCSAAAGKDAAAALARLGKMQIRMRKPTIGQAVQAQVIVSHPNYNGLQFDQASRRYIRAHYVKNINISYNDEVLISVDTGISISEDPSIRFVFTPDKAGILKASVVDSKDQQFSHQKEI
ncbi:MAG: quinoprotein dehydrogenase-associated SoxYZ-like carrier [Gammaproteobacteria bacterium]|nr:MAG: quinoprotein dehydrogenase-associated SoxYZ-like carrier [Gammaproteobacteria bacterium]